MSGNRALLLLALICVSIRPLVADTSYSALNQVAEFVINTSQIKRQMPETLFGVFFEEINRAGDGGLWAEMVRNRGFEAGGRHSPSWIEPWDMVGDESKIVVTTELSSPFENNKVALLMEVLCDKDDCPPGGVGVYNPGFYAMNIQKGKSYNVVFYVRSEDKLNLMVSFTSANGSSLLAQQQVTGNASRWTRKELKLIPNTTDNDGRIQITTTVKGNIWIDQVSVMPADTYKGHGFRSDLFNMLLQLKPRFLRFPGGSFVEGIKLRNAFRWKETVGPWEERPGHFNDAWGYWTDEGLGYFEYLQMAEDLEAEPVWVINNGYGIDDHVNASLIQPFVQEMLDSIEFANGDASTKWGSLRAKMGRVQPFKLNYVAIGNEECNFPQYTTNYMKFYEALKKKYPYIKAISNCDGSASMPLDHPADLYDYHIYTDINSMFQQSNFFNTKPRSGPKAFVSEYAVIEAGGPNDKGTLIGALSEAAFLIGIEINSDVVEMASYAPLFGNFAHLQTKPAVAIFFNNHQVYGLSSFWMQTFFVESSGATLLGSNFETNISRTLVASAISYHDPKDDKNYIKIKIVNFFEDPTSVNVTLEGIEAEDLEGLKLTILTGEPSDINSIDEPMKVVPKSTEFKHSGNKFSVDLPPYCLIAIDLLNKSKTRVPLATVHKSSGQIKGRKMGYDKKNN